MGCGGSKDGAPDDAKSALDIDITKLEKAKSGQPEEDLSPSQRLTASGYMSDLQSDRAAFTHAFVHTHTGRDAIAELKHAYDFESGTVLGRGACGSVVAVRQRETGDMFAMKVVALDTVGGSIEELKQEIEIQRALDHPNICKIFESFEDMRNKELYIIMEICTGGSLVSRMKTHRHGYGERAAATLVEKMLSSIIYCHHHGVVHRDIKLDNFIYENEAEDAELKLIDFGFACEVTAPPHAWPAPSPPPILFASHARTHCPPARCTFVPPCGPQQFVSDGVSHDGCLPSLALLWQIAPGKEAMWDQLGTPSYMAPELWSNTESQYDSSVDMWAIGVVTYMLLSGKRPFHHQDKREKARMIRHDPLRFPSPDWDKVSQEAKDFCSALMQKRPKDRLSATAAKDHPWIKHASTLHSGEDAAHEMARHNEIVDALQNFCEADDLKKLALEVIAFSTPPAKLTELRDMFVKIDVDDSGTISLQEFKDAMALHPEVPQDRVEQMFKDMDIDHSGEVDYSEFLSATLAAQKHSNASVMAAFNTLDVDGDGFITKNDLVKALDGQMTEDSIMDMLQHADASGRVNFQVFKRIVLHGLKTSASSPTHKIMEVASKEKSTKNMASSPSA
jgi:serine/threonine protein kinase